MRRKSANILTFMMLAVMLCLTGCKGVKDISVTSVEVNSVHHNFIRQTAKELKFENFYAVKANVFLYLKSCSKKFDLIFSDAPYDLEGSEEVIKLVLERDLLNDDGILIFEHSKDQNFEGHPNLWQTRSYGSVQFSFFKKV